MGRKAKEYKFSIMNLGANQDVINNAQNLSRWNPTIAIEWMEEILVKVVSPVELKDWNRAAKAINNTIDSIEMHENSYNPEYWGANLSRRLSMQKIEITMEDYAAMQAFIPE